MAYLLDTNVVSEWAARRPEPAVVRWLDEVDEDEVFLSVVTMGELREGVDWLDPPSSERACTIAVAPFGNVTSTIPVSMRPPRSAT